MCQVVVVISGCVEVVMVMVMVIVGWVVVVGHVKVVVVISGHQWMCQGGHGCSHCHCWMH